MQKIISLFVLTLFSSLTFADNFILPKFVSSIHPIPISTQHRMQKHTWNETCPVPLHDLVEVKLTYFGFDHKAHTGLLIVNKKLAEEVVEIFKKIYLHRFPIQQMELMESFNGDDAAMNANNTSAFNCRYVTGESNIFSPHSYGCAIDINPLLNPYVKDKIVLPAAGKKYSNRNHVYPSTITKNSFVYLEFKKHGWKWGGDWHHLHDYQHFQKCHA